MQYFKDASRNQQVEEAARLVAAASKEYKTEKDPEAKRLAGVAYQQASSDFNDLFARLMREEAAE